MKEMYILVYMDCSSDGEVEINGVFSECKLAMEAARILTNQPLVFELKDDDHTFYAFDNVGCKYGDLWRIEPWILDKINENHVGHTP